jgi:deoxyxylulose-5-phosphate synthase
MLEQQQISREQLDALAREFRYVVTDAICRSGSGHIG